MIEGGTTGSIGQKYPDLLRFHRLKHLKIFKITIGNPGKMPMYVDIFGGN